MKRLLHALLLFCQIALGKTLNDIHVLHISFHKGCIKEFNEISRAVGFKTTTMFVPNLAKRYFDGRSLGNALYNIGHNRAKNIWNKHKNYFEQFDVILTSDTAPLARVFLQNNWKKPLIIWVCNRFDYYDGASLDCDFPDKEYYQLMNDAKSKFATYILGYTPFENYYARTKGVNFGNKIIKPSGIGALPKHVESSIPQSIKKEKTFFVPPYHNDKQFNIVNWCRKLGLKAYCGRYNGPIDLKEFKGIIHIPYAWSNLAFFENMHLGIPYFVPSLTFLKKLRRQGNFWYQNSDYFFDRNQYHLSEWYAPEHKGIITYFDSWQDLKNKIETTDFIALRGKIKAFAQKHRQRVIGQWKQIFEHIAVQIRK